MCSPPIPLSPSPPSVSTVKASQALSQRAYMLFYRREMSQGEKERQQRKKKSEENGGDGGGDGEEDDQGVWRVSSASATRNW